MRYLENENPYIICRFTTGDTVTIDIYDLSDDSKDVDGVSMSEIGSTGYFKYLFNPDISTLVEYLYIADNGIEEHAGKIILGGYPDDIKEQIDDLHQLQGLNIANPMTVTPTSREAGTIQQTISGDGKTTSTVTRTA